MYARVAQSVRLSLRLVRAVDDDGVGAATDAPLLGVRGEAVDVRVRGFFLEAPRATEDALDALLEFLAGRPLRRAALRAGRLLHLLLLGFGCVVLTVDVVAAALARGGDDVVHAEAEAAHDLAVASDVRDALELVVR